MTFNPDSINRRLVKLSIKSAAGKFNLDHLYRINIRREHAPTAQKWCQQRFGDEWVWSSPTQTNWTAMYFKTPEDALAFKLAFTGSLTA